MAWTPFVAIIETRRPRPLPVRLLTAAPFVLSATLAAVFISRATEPKLALFDDASISMRYARNLVEGHGLLWNAGEPPVEGYTNFLWTLWMAAVHLLADGSEAALGVMLSGAVLLLVNLALVRALAREVAPDSRPVELASLFLTAASYPLLCWTLNGFEVGLLAAVTSVTVLLTLRLRRLAHARDAFLLAATLALGALTRDDFAIVAVVSLAFLVPVRSRRLLFISAAGFVLAKLGHEVFRFIYYGDLLPNTYYLKVSGFSPLERIGAGGLALLHLAAIELFAAMALALLAAVHAFRAEDDRKAVLLPISVFIAQCIYSVYVGGDAWEYFEFSNRYIAIALPCFFVSVACGMRVLVTGWSAGRRTQALIIAVPLLAAAANVAIALLGPGVLPPTIAKRGEGLRLATAFVALVCCCLILLLATRRRWDRSLAASGLATVALVSVLAVSLNGDEFVRYSRSTDEATLSRKWAADGARLGATLPRDTKIAVFGAGGVPYFSRLSAVDLLGKSDPAVARSRPHRGPFLAGHMKWDYAHSLSFHKPDLVVQGWRMSRADRALFRRHGYREVGWKCARVKSPSIGTVFLRTGRTLACGRARPSIANPGEAARPTG